MKARACLKNHSRNLHAPLCGIFHPNSVAVARYGALIRAKYPTNCDAHLAESLFQTRSNTSKGLLSESIFCHTFLTADPCGFYILYFLKILFFIESDKFPASTAGIHLTYSTVQTRIRLVLPGIPSGTPPANTTVSPTFTSLCFCAASIALRQRISELYSSLISIG